jgi:hypothetical protein
MDKLKLTGRNLARVFKSRLCRACKGHAIEHKTKRPNLKLKTRPKQLLGSLPSAFALPALFLSCLGSYPLFRGPYHKTYYSRNLQFL